MAPLAIVHPDESMSLGCSHVDVQEATVVALEPLLDHVDLQEATVVRLSRSIDGIPFAVPLPASVPTATLRPPRWLYIRVFAKTSTGLFYRPCTLHRDGDHIDVSGFAEGSMLDCRSVSAERYELRCTIRRAGAAEPIHLRIRCLKRSDYAQLVSIGASYVPKSLLDIA